VLIRISSPHTQTPLGELTVLPRPPSWFRSGIPGKEKFEGMGDGWEKGKGGERKRDEKEGGKG